MDVPESSSGAGGCKDSVINAPEPEAEETASLKKEREFQRYINSLKISLKDDSTRCMVERRGRDVSGQWIYLCYPCGATCGGEKVLQAHISGKKHKIKLTMCKYWDPNIFENHPFDKNISKAIPAVVPTEKEEKKLAEPLTLINRVPTELDLKYDKYREVTCHIQESLDAIQSPLLGIEYLIEHPPEEEHYAPTYMCMLCQKQGQPRTIINHMTCYRHRYKYLLLHFPLACNDLTPYRSQIYRNAVTFLLNRLAQRIEDRYGRKRPVNFQKEEYEKNKDEIDRWILYGHHVCEKDGATFEEVVDTGLIASLLKSCKENAPDDFAKSTDEEPSPTDVAPSSKPKWPVKQRADSVMSLSDLSDEANSKHKQERAKNAHKARYEPYKWSETSQSRHRYTRNQSYEDKLKEQKPHNYDYKNKLAKEMRLAVENAAKTTLAYHNKNPEKHPSYPDEWRKFWNKRYKEVQSEGKDPKTYDYKPEWIVYWNARMKVLYKEELHVQVAEIYRKLSLPLPGEGKESSKKLGEPQQSSNMQKSDSVRNHERRRSSTDRFRSSPNRRRSSTDKLRPSPGRRRPSADRLRSSPGRRPSAERRRRSAERPRHSPNHRRPSADRALPSPNRRRLSADRTRPSPDRRRLSSDRTRPSPDRRRLSADKTRPSPDRRRISADRTRPSTDRRRLSADRIRPSPNRRRSSTDRTRLSTDRRRLSADRTRPFADRPHPSHNQRRPSADRPHPSHNQRRPSADRPHPSHDQRRPSADRPHPSHNQRRPSADRPHPSYDQRRPSADRLRLSPRHHSTDRPHAYSDQRRPTFDRPHVSVDRRPHPADRLPTEYPERVVRRDFLDQRDRLPRRPTHEIGRDCRSPPPARRSPGRRRSPECARPPPGHVRTRSRSPHRPRSHDRRSHGPPPPHTTSYKYARKNLSSMQTDLISDDELNDGGLSPWNSDTEILPRISGQGGRSAHRRRAPGASSSPGDVVGTLRQLVALEDYLGSLGPRVVDLLADALTMEKERANSAEQLLERDSALVLLETAKEKLKGAAQAGLVGGSAAAAVRSAVVRVAATLHEADKRAKLKRKEEKVASTEVTTVPVTIAGEINRAQIAQQMAEALIAQGKTDVSTEELAQLVEAVVGMAEAKKREAAKTKVEQRAPVVPAKTAPNKLCGTATALQMLQSTYNENDKKYAEKEGVVDPMEGLSDSDLQTLLKNFNELSAEEQHSLIAYLKKIESTEPYRVERLRQHMSDAANAAPLPTPQPAPASALQPAPASALQPAPSRAPIDVDSDDDDDYTVEEVLQSATQKVKDQMRLEMQKAQISLQEAEEMMQPKNLIDITKSLSSATGLFAFVQASVQSAPVSTPLPTPQSPIVVHSHADQPKPFIDLSEAPIFNLQPSPPPTQNSPVTTAEAAPTPAPSTSASHNLRVGLLPHPTRNQSPQHQCNQQQRGLLSPPKQQQHNEQLPQQHEHKKQNYQPPQQQRYQQQRGLLSPPKQQQYNEQLSQRQEPVKQQNYQPPLEQNYQQRSLLSPPKRQQHNEQQGQKQHNYQPQEQHLYQQRCLLSPPKQRQHNEQLSQQQDQNFQPPQQKHFQQRSLLSPPKQQQNNEQQSQHQEGQNYEPTKQQQYHHQQRGLLSPPKQQQHNEQQQEPQNQHNYQPPQQQHYQQSQSVPSLPNQEQDDEQQQESQNQVNYQPPQQQQYEQRSLPSPPEQEQDNEQLSQEQEPQEQEDYQPPQEQHDQDERSGPSQNQELDNEQQEPQNQQNYQPPPKQQRTHQSPTPLLHNLPPRHFNDNRHQGSRRHQHNNMMDNRGSSFRGAPNKFRPNSPYNQGPRNNFMNGRGRGSRQNTNNQFGKYDNNTNYGGRRGGRGQHGGPMRGRGRGYY